MKLRLRLGAIVMSLGLAASTLTAVALAPPAAANASCRDFLALSIDGTAGNADDKGNTPWTALNRWMGLVGEKRVEAHGVAYPMLAVPYNPSYITGVANVIRTVRDYLNRCPSSKVMFFGFSQGADVAASYLAREPINSSSLLGAALFGDPKFNPKNPYTYDGNGKRNTGMFNGRAATPARYSGKVLSACNKGDLVCSTWDSSLAALYLARRDWHPQHSGYNTTTYSPFPGTSPVDWMASQFATKAAASPKVYNLPAPTPAPPPPPAPSPGFAAGKIAFTGGIGVRLRYAPSVSSASNGAIPEGTPVRIVCQTRGESVTSYAVTTTWWDRLDNGYWVSDAYVETGSNGQVAPNC